MNQYKSRIYCYWIAVRRLGITALISIACVTVNANEPWREAQAGQLFLRGQMTQEPWQQSLHLRSKANVTVSGMVVEVEYTQTFRNISSEWREAIYVFPMAEQAAVHFLSMTIGEREILGQIKEKVEAEKIYQQAKKEGKKAALLDQQRPNLFTQRVANIPPGESISVTIKYAETAEFDGGQFKWRLPMTLTPRYMPGDVRASVAGFGEMSRGEDGTGDPAANLAPQPTTAGSIRSFGWALPTSEVVDADRISPLMRMASGGEDDNAISVSITLAAGLPLADVSALYHDVLVTKNDHTYHVELRDGHVAMDRDFVLQWRPTRSSVPTAALFKQQHDGEDYAMLMVLPPITSALAALPRDVMFILDTSGSMNGQSIEQAKAALVRAINQLGDGDRFNVIEFNSDFSLLFPELREADGQVRRQAASWVNGLRAGGGTEMLPALRAAFDGIEADSPSLKQIVFITDGAVGNEAALFKTINQRLVDSRLFTVGIGSAPNSYFMRKAAQFGRGTFTYIGTAHEVAERMDELFQKLSSAAASNLRFSWPIAAEQFPQKIPDVYRGEPLLVFAKTPALTGVLGLTGDVVSASPMSAMQPWQHDMDLSKLAATVDSPGVARLWARHKIEFLEDQKVAGRDASSVREEVLDLGLSHQLLTPYTSFVAVEQAASRPRDVAQRASPVMNLLPHGQASLESAGLDTFGRSIAYPATATSFELSVWIGLLAVFSLLAIGLQSRACTRRVYHELA